MNEGFLRMGSAGLVAGCRGEGSRDLEDRFWFEQSTGAILEEREPTD